MCKRRTCSFIILDPRPFPSFEVVVATIKCHIYPSCHDIAAALLKASSSTSIDTGIGIGMNSDSEHNRLGNETASPSCPGPRTSSPCSGLKAVSVNFPLKQSSSLIECIQAANTSRTDTDGGLKRRVSEKGRYQLWPVTRKPVTGLIEQSHSFMLERSASMSRPNGSIPETTLSPSRFQSLKTKYKEGNLTSRRKRDIPDLGVGPMTTVQEVFLDSRRWKGLPPREHIVTSTSNHPWIFPCTREI